MSITTNLRITAYLFVGLLILFLALQEIGIFALQTATRDLDTVWTDNSFTPCLQRSNPSESNVNKLENALKNLKSKSKYLVLSKNQVFLTQARIRCFLDQFDLAALDYEAYIERRPDNPLARLELALALIHGDKVDQAKGELVSSHISIEDILIASKQAANQNNLERADSLLEIANLLDENSLAFWNEVGLLCQKYNNSMQTCQRYIDKGKINLLVNAKLDAGLAGWNIIGEVAILDPCEEHKCIQLNQTVAKSSASQCLLIYPGTKYSFSAWIKVDAPANAVWRPLYLQGIVNDTPHGIWPGDQYSSSAWHFWEFEFTAPEFDNTPVCVYPVRLMDSGQALFYSPKLEIIEP